MDPSSKIRKRTYRRWGDLARPQAHRYCCGVARCEGEDAEAYRAFGQMTEAIQRLEDRLRYAQKRFEEAGDSGREGALFALFALHDFICEVDDILAPGLEDPILQLAGALNDLNFGTVHPMLKPIKIDQQGAPKSSLDRTRLRSMSAVAMTLLMKTGCSKKEAAQRVARSLQKAGFKLGGFRGAPTAGTVAGWRERVTGGTSEDPDTQSYRHIMSNLEESGQEPKKLAENLLNQIEAGVHFPHLKSN